MIILALLNVIGNLLLWIVSFIPDNYPESLDNIFATVSDDVSNGCKILLFYFDTSFLSALLTFFIDFYLVYYSIRLIKFIISIIPFLNINIDK